MWHVRIKRFVVKGKGSEERCDLSDWVKEVDGSWWRR